jgi:hypothetical protein
MILICFLGIYCDFGLRATFIPHIIMLFPQLYPSQNDNCFHIHSVGCFIYDLEIDKRTTGCVMYRVDPKSTNKGNFTSHLISIFSSNLCCFLKFNFYMERLETHRSFKLGNEHRLKLLIFHINFLHKSSLGSCLKYSFS